MRTLGQVIVLFFVAITAAVAADNTNKADTQVAYQKPLEAAQPVAGGQDLIFSSAPRETPEEASKIYGPVAAYLSKVLGRKVVYKYAGNWGVYQGQMQKGVYDLVFDGAHFNGWRVEKLHHNILLKVPGDLVFVVATKKADDKLTNIQQLA